MRRVFCSSSIPKAMYATLHINSVRQASRVVPSLSLVPLSVSLHAGLSSQMLASGVMSSLPIATTASLLEEICAMLQDEISLAGTVWCKRNMNFDQTDLLCAGSMGLGR